MGECFCADVYIVCCVYACDIMCVFCACEWMRELVYGYVCVHASVYETCVLCVLCSMFVVGYAFILCVGVNFVFVHADVRACKYTCHDANTCNSVLMWVFFVYVCLYCVVCVYMLYVHMCVCE